MIGTVAEPMIGFGGNVYMLAFFQLQRAIATNNVGDSFNHNPMFAAARVTLQTQPCPGFNFESFYLISWAFFQNFVASPWSLVGFSHQVTDLQIQ